MIASASAATPSLEAGQTLHALARAVGGVVASSAGARRITSLCGDSREAQPGSLFFAVSGAKEDGARYLAEVAARGAVAAVVAPEAAAAADAAGLTALVVDSVRRAKALAAHAFHGEPSHALDCVGITGTKGKTTTAALLHALLAADGRAPSLLGTIEERIHGRPPRASSHTTPDALRLAQLLAEARDAGGRSLVMEVSSHALDQERVTGMRFRAALFTQLAREHLDYHPTLDHYRDSKARLFQQLGDEAFAIVNGEDVHSLDLVARSRARVRTYGEVPGADARLRTLDAQVTGSALVVELSDALGGGTLELRVALPGRHNAMNALGAATAALALGVPRAAIARGLATLRQVAGRLEPVDAGQPFAVLVDYAHTDDSLEKILRLLRPLARGRLITVFGCGGERDRTKRPRMGRVATLLSDRTIVTSDNPRGESPEAIAAEIVAGAAAGAACEVVLDRRAAIARALATAGAGDVVLIAGKGHEDYQLAGDRRLRFDDREVARELLCRSA